MRVRQQTTRTKAAISDRWCVPHRLHAWWSSQFATQSVGLRCPGWVDAFWDPICSGLYQRSLANVPATADELLTTSPQVIAKLSAQGSECSRTPTRLADGKLVAELSAAPAKVNQQPRCHTPSISEIASVYSQISSKPAIFPQHNIPTIPRCQWPLPLFVNPPG